MRVTLRRGLVTSSTEAGCLLLLKVRRQFNLLPPYKPTPQTKKSP